MPQMAPLNWLTLLFFFILIFFLFNIKNYNLINYQPTSTKIKKIHTSFNWKW